MEFILQHNYRITVSGVLKDKRVLIIFLISFISALGILAIVPGIPRIIRDFKVPTAKAQLILSMYSLPGIFFCPLFGLLIDRFDKKYFLFFSIFFYGLTGLLTVFVNSFHQLLILRFLQGLNVSFLIILNITMISDIENLGKRRKIFGMHASILSLGGILWPIAGGFLANLDWHLSFYLFILPLLLSFYTLTVKFSSDKRRINTNHHYFKEIIKIFKRNVNILFTIVVIFLTYAIFFGSYLTYFPIYIDSFFSIDSSFIGIIMASTRIVAVIISAQLYHLNQYFSLKTLFNLFIGFYALALIIIPVIDHSFLLFIPAMIWGCAHGIFLPLHNIFLTENITDQYKASIVSWGRVVNRAGQTIGPFMMGCIFSFSGIKSVFWISALIWIFFLLFKWFCDNKRTS